MTGGIRQAAQRCAWAAPGCTEYSKVDLTAERQKITTSSAVNAETSLEGIYNEINWIREVYRNNSRNFVAVPIKL